ncbi:hypothetical protein PFJ87_08g01940 [Encephalitozoon hellem]|uniref:Uncharacterized protein n=1 Tax=Encephalitozoon hellem TaxID=27973 RepID=A0ABY8CKA2_ENCHE|nr:hypothetical protein PFJ87_08g01940 [Encephalitozoon hellem]
METVILKSFVSLLSNIIFAAEIGLVVLGIVHPCLHGLVALVFLVFIQRGMFHRVIGVFLIIIYLKLFLGSSFELSTPSKICSSDLSGEIDCQERDESSSSSDHLINDDGRTSSSKTRMCRDTETCNGHFTEEPARLLDRNSMRCCFCSRVFSLGE